MLLSSAPAIRYAKSYDKSKQAFPPINSIKCSSNCWDNSNAVLSTDVCVN